MRALHHGRNARVNAAGRAGTCARKGSLPKRILSAGRASALLFLSCLASCEAGTPDSTPAGRREGEVRSADGVAIRYEVRGSHDPTIVLVHGWTNSRGIWGEHPETLSRAHRVVALDLAGHGASGADRRDWTVDAFGEDVVAVVNDLGLDQVVLVGFSMGGAVVLEAAERLADRVLGVVLVDTFKDPEVAPSAADAEQFAAAMRANWRDTAFIRAFAFTPEAPDSLIEYVMGMMPAQPLEHWFTVLQSVVEWESSQLKPTLQSIEVPIAAINTATPMTNVEAMRRYVPSFWVDTMAGVGHGGILLRRVSDFDTRLLAIVERFSSGNPGDQPGETGAPQGS